MSLLGEINKTSEALRYHAKTAEIAGQNLAHVNDENYARQRVLAREGVMYGSFGELQTSSLEAGGLDHARSELLDKRVIMEVGESSSLEAKKEILELLQAALGETIVNPGINAGLDDMHDSILAPGSLARSMNDFFNSFHELSASPDEPTIKQALYNKTETLVRRINDAGSSLDQIESDLSDTVRRSVDDVNRVLAQLHEVNKQVRRFELQDKGKAVSYRDRRQALLEELSRLMDFKVVDDIDSTTGKPSGFINIFANSKDGREVNLLDPVGPKNMTNDWNQEIVLGESLIERDLRLQGLTDPVEISSIAAQEVAKLNPSGSQAQLRAKIDGNGQLGRVEILDGGSLYDDTDDPILVTFLPPKPILGDAPNNQEENVDPDIGDQDAQGAVALAGQPVDIGNEIADGVGDAQLLAESGNLSLENSARNKGDVFYFKKILPDGSVDLALWQALEDTVKGVDPNVSNQFMEIKNWPNGKVEQTRKTHSDLETYQKGDQLYYEGQYYQALDLVTPVNEEEVIEGGISTTTRNYLENDVFKHGEQYFQAVTNIPMGAELDFEVIRPGQEQGLLIGTKVVGTVLALGEDLPSDGNVVDLALETLIPKGGFVEEAGEFFMYVGNDNFDTTKTRLQPASDRDNFVKVNAHIDSSVQILQEKLNEASLPQNAEDGLEFYDNEIFYQEINGQSYHFIVVSSPDTITEPSQIETFNPTDPQWSSNFHFFKPQLLDDTQPRQIVRLSSPKGFNTENGVLEEVNLGIAEAVLKGGEIKSFNIISKGNGFPSSDAILIEGGESGGSLELDLKSGSIHGYQMARTVEMEKFRTGLNDLVKTFVEKVNGIYNSTDEPGGYLFGFDSFLSRPVTGNNKIMEDSYDLYGLEGDGEFILFRDEVDMTLPTADSDTFQIVNSTPIYPDELKNNPEAVYVRGEDATVNLLASESGPSIYEFYGSARRMQNVTFETDATYPGQDQLMGTRDDGRSILLGYEDIPFRIEQGDRPFIIGDNFSFDAILENDWNLATSLRVDDDLTADNIKASDEFAEGENDVAFEISKLADGVFADKISVLNADIGNEMSDLNDNLDHQKSIESLLLDQRRAVSSVSIDEEVADLMQFQRSFQASSRVLNTLDKMLELVVMGLLK
tara:strand:- start:5327 stop:8719 length:3393 start_codon:yes stop_codon:yes gene_type:complete